MPVGFGFWSLSAQVRRIADLSAEDTTVERVRDAIADQGWAGFADLTGLARAVAVLALASLLGASLRTTRGAGEPSTGSSRPRLRRPT
jgi:hypothetical protein